MHGLKLAIVSAALGAALAAGAKPAAKKEAAPPGAQATPHVAMTLAAVHASQDYAAGLYTMAQDPKAFDVPHARMFLRRLGDEVELAKEHLHHLRSVGRARPDAAGKLAEADRGLDEAAKALAGLEPGGDEPKAFAAGARRAWETLERAGEAVGEAAQVLGAPEDLLQPKE